MGFELFGLAKAEFRFKLNKFTKIKRGKNRDFVFFSVHPFFRFIRFRFIAESIGAKKHPDRSFCDKSMKIGTNDH